MEYEKEILAFRQEFLTAGGSFDGCGSLRHFDKVQDWLDQCEMLKSKDTLQPGLVTSSQYIYLREEDRKVVGVIQIRHYFNDYLEKFGGHIGYSVCPSERRKGYATQMLQLALPICRKLGIDRVLVTCLDDNEGSRRTILKCGGVYESTVYEPQGGVRLERYWIENGDNMIFRKGTAADIDGIMQFVKEIIKQPDTAWDEEYPAPQFFEESLGHDGLYVAEENGRVIATVGIHPAVSIFKDLDCWSKEHKNPALGCRLGVAPDHQGQHLAERLLRYALDDAAKKGFDSFHFTVEQHNNSAKRLYDRCGFRNVGETNWIDEDWFCYECELPFK